jgi:hypothetical protein
MHGTSSSLSHVSTVTGGAAVCAKIFARVLGQRGLCEDKAYTAYRSHESQTPYPVRVDWLSMSGTERLGGRTRTKGGRGIKPVSGRYRKR